MSRDRSTTAVAALCALCAGAAPAAAQSPGGALDRGLRELVASQGGPPGAIALVQRGGTLEVHTAGVAQVGRARPPRPGDAMRVASVAKAFSGAVALSLVDRGDLSLGDAIGERLPGLPRPWHRVTLRQLLDHTSGVPDFIATPAAQRAVLASPGTAPPPERLLRFVAGRPLSFAPGSRYRYSNSDNIVVGLMIQAATGRAYEAELRRLVVRPLGLGKTGLPRGTALGEPAMRGYAPDPPNAPEDVTEFLAAGWAWASGGVVSTPRSLNRFIRAYVGGRLFGGAARAQQRRVVAGGRSEPNGPGRNAAGLALFRYRTRCGVVWGHTGNTFGYTQFAAASSDGTRSVTVSISRQIGREPEDLLAKLREVEEEAVCAALAPGGAARPPSRR